VRVPFGSGWGYQGLNTNLFWFCAEASHGIDWIIAKMESVLNNVLKSML
jgi:hypothetical protein